MSLLQVENISTGYGKKAVLHEVSLQVEASQIVTLIGSNGAGKSTLLKAIYALNGIWNEGKVFFDGEEITATDTRHLLQKGLVYIGQKNNLFDGMSVEENLKTAAYIYPKAQLNERLAEVYALLPLLKTWRLKGVMELSGGQRQLVALGMGLLHRPKLILFDEPSAGLDVKKMNEVFSIIKQLKIQNGISFLIVEHRVKEIANITDRWIGLKLGKKVYDNSTIGEYDLKEIFL